MHVSGVLAPLFHRQCRPSTGTDRKFSEVTFSHKALTEQAYVLLAAKLLFLGNHHLARASPALWELSLKNLAWLCGADFRGAAMANATKQLDFAISAWNSRLHLSIPFAFYLFTIPFSVLGAEGPLRMTAVGAVALNPERRKEAYGFAIRSGGEPDWDRTVPDLFGTVSRAPEYVVYDGELSALRRAAKKIWPETSVTSPRAEDFPQTLPPFPQQSVLDSWEKALRDLELQTFPDTDSAYLLIGGIMVDRETAWDRQHRW